MNTEEDDIYQLTHEELMNVEGDRLRWHCSVEGCQRYCTALDFATFPMVYVRRFKPAWQNLSERIFLCAGHWPTHRKSPEKLQYKPGPGAEHCSWSEEEAKNNKN